jgi:hypothetical protein
VQWQSEALHHGHTPHDHVYYNTDYLVASRHDTTKARAARATGRTQVITYAEWETTLNGGMPQFRPSMPVSPGAAQPRFIPPSSADRRELAHELAGLPDTPPSLPGERIRKINV